MNDFHTHVSCFTWIKERGLLCADASTLGFRPGLLPRVLHITSEHTGVTGVFNRGAVRRSPEGELESILFFPENGAVGNCSLVEIFND